MTKLHISKGLFSEPNLAETGAYIAAVQSSDGSIPWFEGGVVDPWDHVEAAMGLVVAGRVEEAKSAYRWLAAVQRPDGSWYAAYRDGQVVDASRIESNFVAYVATGVWHYYLATADVDTAAELWPCVREAMNFVISLQSDHGEIAWASHPHDGPRSDALVTGCSSIFKSLECAAALALRLDEDPSDLLAARSKLQNALLTRPDRFDRTWPSKGHYSMDWFYPVLTGVIEGGAAEQRLRQRWDEFVVSDHGCKCVADEPWVTVAETCELTMALVASGDHSAGMELFSWIHEYRHDDGSWWTGFVYRDAAVWPNERPTWTSGAVLLAADALAQRTPAHHLFSRRQVDDSSSTTLQNAQRLRHWTFGE